MRISINKRVKTFDYFIHFSYHLVTILTFHRRRFWLLLWPSQEERIQSDARVKQVMIKTTGAHRQPAR